MEVAARISTPRLQCVRIGESLSVVSGVPQGTPLVCYFDL